MMNVCDHNIFFVDGGKYRWEHNYDGRGTACLVCITDPWKIGEDTVEWGSREGALKLRQGEWVFTRGTYKPPLCTGTSDIHEAKKIVQVRLTMEIRDGKQNMQHPQLLKR